MEAAASQDAKQRRTVQHDNSTLGTLEQGKRLVTALDLEYGAPKEQSKRQDGILRRVVRIVRRRAKDIMGQTALWTSWVLGYAYVQAELIYPLSPLATLFNVICHIVFALAISCWMGAKYHGPGRVPIEGKSQLPKLLVQALNVGKLNHHHPFSGEDTWCDKCQRWKPPLASHCSACNRCSMWMDHHCSFTGTCIGFRNFRNFLMMLIYTNVLIVCLAIVCLRHFLLTPASLLQVWTASRFLAFIVGGYKLLGFSRQHVKVAVAKIAYGWPSWVMLEKFQGVIDHAQVLARKGCGRDPSLVQKDTILGQLIEAIKRLQLRGFPGLHGLVGSKNRLERLVLVFGEDVSWKWFLPWRAGGTGNPLAPTNIDSDVCGAWADLADAFIAQKAILSKAEEEARAAKKQQQERIQAMLAYAESVTKTSNTSQ